MDKTAIKQFSVYLVEHESLRVGGTIKDSVQLLRAKGLESLEPRVLGGFSEWLLDSAGLNPKTVATRLSYMKMFWDWCIRKHIISGPNS
ncbi:hypothetical protein [Acetobacter sp. P5B1]|uniref:hypothetical protein n=1 Tax=Acetobacter sp. P5B1 TaxID=2762620 RepID=UPI001C04900F|nr:hypothetical protein [Acetobacter sp. P5B1]